MSIVVLVRSRQSAAAVAAKLAPVTSLLRLHSVGSTTTGRLVASCHTGRYPLGNGCSIVRRVSRLSTDTSRQLGYTVPFTLVHAGKYRTEYKLKPDTTQNKHNPEKANNAKHSKTKLVWFSRFLRHSARKQGGLILQHS